MNCTPATRENHRRLAARLRGSPEVIAVDSLSPSDSPTGFFETEILCDSSTVPPAVATAIGENGLRITEAMPQGGLMWLTVR